MSNSTLPSVYSPVAEAERYLAEDAQASRLGVARRVLEQPVWQGLRARLRDAPGPAVAAHLDAAARVLACEGWTQGQMRAAGGEVCLFKALDRAAELGFGDRAVKPGRDFRTTTHYVAGSYLNLMVLARTGRPDWYLGWNDTPGRQVGEVLELVGDAAALARTVG